MPFNAGGTPRDFKDITEVNRPSYFINREGEAIDIKNNKTIIQGANPQPVPKGPVKLFQKINLT